VHRHRGKRFRPDDVPDGGGVRGGGIELREGSPRLLIDEDSVLEVADEAAEGRVEGDPGRGDDRDAEHEPHEGGTGRAAIPNDGTDRVRSDAEAPHETLRLRMD